MSTLSYQRRAQLSRKYGMTEENFHAMYDAQGGRCAICRCQLSPACVDHDHSTGVVRGLLCSSCNKGLGFFNDDTRLLAYALVYLEDHGKVLG